MPLKKCFEPGRCIELSDATLRTMLDLYGTTLETNKEMGCELCADPVLGLNGPLEPGITCEGELWTACIHDCKQGRRKVGSFHTHSYRQTETPSAGDLLVMLYEHVSGGGTGLGCRAGLSSGPTHKVECELPRASFEAMVTWQKRDLYRESAEYYTRNIQPYYTEFARTGEPPWMPEIYGYHDKLCGELGDRFLAVSFSEDEMRRSIAPAAKVEVPEAKAAKVGKAAMSVMECEGLYLLSELKDMARKAGLDHTGTKDKLCSRLIRAGVVKQ